MKKVAIPPKWWREKYAAMVAKPEWVGVKKGGLAVSLQRRPAS